MRRHIGRAALVLAVAMAAAGCGSSESSPTQPSGSGTGVTLVSCNTIRYQGASRDGVCAPIPGQSLQPSGVHLFFPNQSYCIRATCSAGCVSAAAVGTNVGGTCS